MIINTKENDTIAAIATPIGTAGISIIRLSGPESFNIASKIFTSSLKNTKTITFEHSKFYHGWIIDNKDGSLIDESLILAFKSPKSYTTEDVIEIQCHGGLSVSQKILQLCLNNGARAAECGEFTKRAFIGGRIDLTQVEAVLDIISAKTDLFSSAAAYNLSGKLSLLINDIRSSLIDLISHIEASLDFPDEVDEIPYHEIKNNITNIINTINTVLDKATDGNILKYGIKVAIIGKPNVGKSSLFNYLLNTDRAIVTNIPGTTRDILQEFIDIDGIPVILTDTAGIRDIKNSNDSDHIETIGVNRSKDALKNSDLILFIYDSTCLMSYEDNKILEEINHINKPILKVGNKLDLLKNKQISHTDILVSAITGENITLLKQSIKDIILGQNFKVSSNEAYINIRHRECLNKAKYHLELALNACNNNEMQDLISIDIKAALISLGEITGEVLSEDIVNRIFSQFCIGK